MNVANVQLDRFRPYLPDVIRSAGIFNGEALHREAFTLFADVAGFTALSERLSREGTRGTEQLGAIIRHVIGGATDIARDNGGDVLAFGGDAITVEFPSAGSDWSVPRSVGEQILQLVTSHRERLPELEDHALSVRVGISAGRVTSLVTDPAPRRVLLHLGPGLDRAVAAASSTERNTVLVDEHAVVNQRKPEPLAALPQWAPTLFHPLTASRIAEATEPPDEHRWLTCAFFSLPPVDDLDVGALANLKQFVATAADTLSRFGGDILQCSGGDKGIVLISVFGTPIAHPDGAARALYATEQIRANTTMPFSAGISTGLAFTAAFGGRHRQFVSVLGDSVNIGAALMMSASEGSTLINHDVTRSLGRGISIGPSRLIPAKNRNVPVRATSVTLTSVESVSPDHEGENPLVGRDRELREVDAFLNVESTRATLRVVGAPGMGKSRLLNQIAESARIRGLIVRRFQFEPFGVGRPLGPFVEFLRSRPGLPEIRNDDDLLNAITLIRPADRILAPLLSPLLGFAMPENPATRPMSGQHRLEVGRRLIADLICAVESPVLLVLDDVHWADESSMQLIDDLDTRLHGSAIRLLTASRPHAGPVRSEDLSLGEMSSAALGLVVRDTWSRLGGSPLPADYIDSIIERAAGSPMFAQTVTELVRRRYRPGFPLPDVPLPNELLPFLTSSLDQLGDEAQLTALQLAILGEPIEPTEFGEIFDLTESSRAAEIDRLTEAGIARVSDDQGRIALRHPTIAEALVERSSHEMRAPLHETVCRYLIRSNGSPRDVAGHLEHCHLSDLEPDAYRMARREAEEAWALAEARHWGKLVIATSAASAAQEDVVALAALEERLGEHATALDLLQGSSGREAELLLGRIAFETGRAQDAVLHLEAAEALGAEGAEVSWPLTMALCELGRFDEAENRALSELDQAGMTDPNSRLDALANLGVVAFRQGDIDRADEVLSEAHELATQEGDVLRLTVVTGDLAGARFMREQLSDSVTLLTEAAAMAERLGTRRLVVMALGNAAHVRLAAGDNAGAERAAIAAADAALDMDEAALALDFLNIAIVVAEVDDRISAATSWWGEQAEIEARMERVNDSAICRYRQAAASAQLRRMSEAEDALKKGDSIVKGAELDTQDLETHRERAVSAIAGEYTPPPELVDIVVELPPLDATVPEVAPNAVAERLSRIASLIDERDAES